MLTKKQKAQIRLLCRQHNKMEAAGMKVRSYHAFHGMNAFTGDEWYWAAEKHAIHDLFNGKFTRLSDQHSETCWSDTPIGLFGLVGEVDGLRSPIDLWSRPIVDCDTRVNGLRTVRPSRLDLAIKIMKGKERGFGHTEILAQQTQDLKFWVKADARRRYDMIEYLDHVAESAAAETTVKAYVYQRVLSNMDDNDVNDNNVIDAVITQAEDKGLEVITIDDAGAIVDAASSISSIEEIEEYLGGYYLQATIEETMKQVCFEVFQEFLEDGDNAQLASFCCPAWAAKEIEIIYDEMVEYKEELIRYRFNCWREVLDGFSTRINSVIDCIEKYAKDSIKVVYNAIDRSIDLFNEMVEEMEEMEEDEASL